MISDDAAVAKLREALSRATVLIELLTEQMRESTHAMRLASHRIADLEDQLEQALNDKRE